MFMLVVMLIKFFEVIYGSEAQVCDYKGVRRLWVLFPLEKIKYLMFSFTRFSNDAKYGVDLSHPTGNISRIQWKVGNRGILMGMECLYTWFHCVRDTA